MKKKINKRRTYKLGTSINKSVKIDTPDKHMSFNNYFLNQANFITADQKSRFLSYFVTQLKRNGNVLWGLNMFN